MDETSPQQPPRRQPTSHPSARLRLAASSSSPELHPAWAWGLTAAVILLGGVTLYVARSSFGNHLDRWLPKLQPPEETASTIVTEAPPAPQPAPQLAPEPTWTYVDIETAIRPLPEGTEALITEGRGEMSAFEDLDSADETRALVTGNRWRRWGPIWHNRVAQIRNRMPPAESCFLHAALEPTCRAVQESLAALDRVPTTSNIEEAKEVFDEAAAILEALRQSEAEAEEETQVSEDPTTTENG